MTSADELGYFSVGRYAVVHVYRKFRGCGSSTRMLPSDRAIAS